MRTPPRSVRLAGEELRDRHVALLADGPDEVYAVLLPFIVEGFDAGDRAVHIVDPALREEHLARLEASGVDVAAATASGQLVIKTWTETYLKGGSFDRRAQLGFIRESLAEGHRQGYAMTRLIGNLDWAVEIEGVMHDVLAYERATEDLVRTKPDVVICTYDLSRHSARAVADVLGVHPGAVVAGVPRTSRAPERPSARERLLTAASDLFYEVGIQGAGVDAIIEAAGVAKATFYRHFPSKDDLVLAWLRDPRARWFERVRARVDEDRPSSTDLVPRLFDALAEWLETERYRGCPYLNTAIEIADPAHPARLVVAEYLQEIEDNLAEMLAAAGIADPRRTATHLQTLIAGSITLSVARRNTSAVDAAREAAIGLVAEGRRRAS